jgi:hypothetical protein
MYHVKEDVSSALNPSSTLCDLRENLKSNEATHDFYSFVIDSNYDSIPHYVPMIDNI